MLLPIRRPVRPEPLPLRERSASDAAARPPCVWLSVRTKRHRPAPLPGHRLLSARRARFAAPQS